MSKVVVMASGEGSNFSAIVESGIVVDKVITENPNANVIRRAEKVGVPVSIINKKEEYNHGLGWFERRIHEEIPEDTDLIVMAGFMRILSPWFVEQHEGKMINIHPSLLPAFAGTCRAVEEAYEHGCQVFGVTVHWVTAIVDDGPIITQRALHKFDDDTLEDIIQKIHSIEYYLYPKTIKKLIQV